MAMIATTIINSISVNPLGRFMDLTPRFQRESNRRASRSIQGKKKPRAGRGFGKTLRNSQKDQRHSEGAYLASSVAAVETMPRLVAVVFVEDAHAQSMVPGVVSVRAAFFTFGVKVNVWAFRPVGMPLLPSAFTIMVITPVVGATSISVTYLEPVLALPAAYSAAAEATPVMPLVAKPSDTPTLAGSAPTTASEIFERMA